MAVKDRILVGELVVVEAERWVVEKVESEKGRERENKTERRKERDGGRR